jgi:hypothetical protein
MAVYVLIDEKRHCCKIGFSRDIESAKRRVATLQTASPFPLRVAGINPGLGQTDERSLHKKLGSFKTGGGREWFDLTQEPVQAVVKSVVGDGLLCDAELESSVDQQSVPVQCSCNCSHVADDDSETGYCDTCSDMFDWFGECCVYCVRSRYGFDGETEDWHREHNKRILRDRHQPPMFSQLFPYLSGKRDYRPVFTGDIVRVLLDDASGDCIERATFGSLSGACLLADCLSQPIFDELEKPVFPVLHLCGGLILVAYPCEFGVGMPQAEQVYRAFFWDVDVYACQLFVCCVNSARDVRHVPLSMAHYQSICGK